MGFHQFSISVIKIGIGNVRTSGIHRNQQAASEEGNSLDEQIAVDEAEAKLEKQIEDLEKKARTEKQPRKRLELFEEFHKNGPQTPVSHHFAEREGFEPPEAFTSTVFKTAVIDHSTISPIGQQRYAIIFYSSKNFCTKLRI